MRRLAVMLLVGLSWSHFAGAGTLRQIWETCNPLRLLGKKHSAEAEPAEVKVTQPQTPLDVTPSRSPQLTDRHAFEENLPNVLSDPARLDPLLSDAAYTISRMGGLMTPLLETIERLVESKDPEIRRAAARVFLHPDFEFSKFMYPAFARSYWEPGRVLLSDESDAAQKMGLQLLARTARSYARAEINFVIDQMMVRKSDRVSDEVLDSVLKHRKSPDPKDRAAVAEIIAHWKSQSKVRDILNELKMDVDSEVRGAAEQSLSFSGKTLLEEERSRFLSDRRLLDSQWDTKLHAYYAKTAPFFLERFPQYKEEWLVLSTLQGFDTVAIRDKQKQASYKFDPVTQKTSGDPASIEFAEFVKNGLPGAPDATIRAGFHGNGKMNVRFERLPEGSYQRAIAYLSKSLLPSVPRAALISYLEQGMRSGNKTVEISLDPEDREALMGVIQFAIIGYRPKR